MAEVLLPAIYLDAVALSEPAAVVLMNQSPAALEDNVDPDSLVVLDIAVANGFTLDTAEVFVDGNSAWTLAGGFTVGWNGVGSGTSAPDADTLRISIDPTTDFTSDATVTVQATGTSTGLTALDETYTFDIEDTTPPQVIGAEAFALNQVTVTFNEPMKQVAATNVDDALNPANYVLTPQSFPAVTVSVLSVAVLSTTEFVITTNIDLSHGIQYLVQVNTAEDVSGNALVAPLNQAFFVAFTPDIPAGRVWDLYKLLPKINRDEDVTGDLLNFVKCLQDVTDLLLFDIDAFSNILDKDIAAEQYVDNMLCDLGNPFSFADLSLVDKRRLISILVPLYKQKGTCIGLENAIRFFVQVDVTCVQPLLTCMQLGVAELGEDWTLCPSSSVARYTFDIDSPVVLTDAQITQIIQISDLMKPAHTHLGNILDPNTPVPDHVELGVSQLGETWDLH